MNFRRSGVSRSWSPQPRGRWWHARHPVHEVGTADGYTLVVGGSQAITVNPDWSTEDVRTTRRRTCSRSPACTSRRSCGGAPEQRNEHALATGRRGAEEPGQAELCLAGVATSQHMTAELFCYVAKLDMQHVAYKGSGPAMTDLLGGQVTIMMDGVASALPHITSGKLKALAVTTAQRMPQLPNVPTIAESGYPGFLGVGWAGLFMPVGRPNALVDKISADVRAVLNDPEVKQRIVDRGAIPDPRRPNRPPRSSRPTLRAGARSRRPPTSRSTSDARERAGTGSFGELAGRNSGNRAPPRGGAEARRCGGCRQHHAGTPDHPRAHRRAGRCRLVPGSRRPHRPGTLRGRQAQERDAGALRDGPRAHRRAPGRRSAARTSPCAAAPAGAATARRAARAASSRTWRTSYRIPLVNLIDGSGGSVTSITPPRPCGVSRRAWLRALGGAAGRGAGRERGARHRGGRTGGPRHPVALVGDGEGHEPGLRRRPPVVERSLGQKITKEELGGPRSRSISPARSTTSRESEEECFAMIRRFLSYMPQQRLGAAAALAAERSRRPVRGGACCASCRKRPAPPYDMRQAESSSSSTGTRCSRSSRPSARRSSPASRA